MASEVGLLTIGQEVLPSCTAEACRQDPAKADRRQNGRPLSSNFSFAPLRTSVCAGRVRSFVISDMMFSIANVEKGH
jgi:hypothetical protein